MTHKYSTNPSSLTWLSVDDYPVASYFGGMGFHNLKDILEMRVYDLMNMDTFDAIRVEEIITCLYKYLNSNSELDKAIYSGTASQPFDYSKWRKSHRDLSAITVSELVFIEDANLYAIQDLYDVIRAHFFKSAEYNPREYRYRDKAQYDMLRKQKGEPKDE